METSAPRQSGEPLHDDTETGLTALEAAARLGVHERTIRRAIARGELAAIKHGGLFRISLDALDRYQAQRPGFAGPEDGPGLADDASRPIRAEAPAPKLVVIGPEPQVHAPLRQPLDSFVGREEETAELQALLLRLEVRLLTLTGPGGVGKTRLALAAAAPLEHHFADGIAFVPLAAISDPNLVLSTIARALGLRDAGDRHLADGLGAALRHREMLLILDNFEQVVSGSPVVASLLSVCPGMTVLATSREPLRLSGERRFPVSPLPIPSPATQADERDLARFAGVALFLERAHRVRPGFMLTAANARTIAAICDRLDGLPLAIEMAAAWLGTLSPEALLARLEYRLPLLTGNRDLPDRQRTMRDAVAWSYDLLSPEEERCFRHMAVFVGGFSLDAAERVGRETEDGGGEHFRPPSPALPPPPVLTLVAQLIEKSLLVQEPGDGDEPRFMMLETVREFGLERLAASDELRAARDAHAAWSLALALEAGPRVLDADQTRWLDLLEREHDNLRAALAWLHEIGDEASSVAMVSALWLFWYIRGHVAEGLRWLDQALALGAATPNATRVNALIGAGQLAHYQGESARAAAYLDRSLAMSRALGDTSGAALSLLELGIVAEDRGDYAAATEALGEARGLFATLPPSPNLAMTTYHLAIVAYGQGDLVRAETLCEEALRQARENSSAFSIAAVQTQFGLVACDLGDTTAAMAALSEGVSLYVASKDLEGIARCLANFAVLATVRRNWEPAARLLGAVETMKDVLGYGFAYPEAPRYERAEQETRTALGPAFAELRDAGQALSIDDALEEAFRLAESAPPLPTAPDRFGLTPREREVLQLVAAGLADREIAEALFISRHTAMTHVSNILMKLDVGSRTAAAALAIRDGIV